MELNDLLMAATKRGASDVHLTPGEPPVFRLSGTLERQGELTVRSLGTVWGIVDTHSLEHFKVWLHDHAAFIAQPVYSFLASPGWGVTGVVGVILALPLMLMVAIGHYHSHTPALSAAYQEKVLAAAGALFRTPR